MRNALIVLVVVALALVVLGAVNNDLLFDIDVVVGTWTAVSLFWVAAVVAGVVFVSGLAAAFLAQSGAVAARRKLEGELQTTYERLRAAEARLPTAALDIAPAVEIAPGQQTAVTAVPVADAASTAVQDPPAAETVATGPSDDAETTVLAAEPSDDSATLVGAAAPETRTVVTQPTVPGDAGEPSPLGDAEDASAPAAS